MEVTGRNDSCCEYEGKTRPWSQNPTQFEVWWVQSVGRFTIAMVKYPGCTNFQGCKLLVYEHVSPESIRDARTLDPNFRDVPQQDTKNPVPFARFEPTVGGISTALRMAAALEKDVTSPRALPADGPL